MMERAYTVHLLRITAPHLSACCKRNIVMVLLTSEGRPQQQVKQFQRHIHTYRIHKTMFLAITLQRALAATTKKNKRLTQLMIRKLKLLYERVE